MLLDVPIEELWLFKLLTVQAQEQETQKCRPHAIHLVCGARYDGARRSQGCITCHQFDVLVRPTEKPCAHPLFQHQY